MENGKKSRLTRLLFFFIDHHITGPVVLDLDNEALKAMGVSLVGERVRLLVGIKALRQECYASTFTAARLKQQPPDYTYLHHYPPPANVPANAAPVPPQPPPSAAAYGYARNDYRNINQSTVSVPVISTNDPDKPTSTAATKPTEGKSLLNRSNSFSRFLGRSDSKKARNANANTSQNTPPAQDPAHLPPSPRTVQKRNSLEGGIMSMEKVKQTCVKVFGEDGQTRIVNVHNATTAKMVMAKVLHKFGIDESNADRYCVFVGSSTHGEARTLSDAELMDICQSPDRPEKERLILRKRHLYPTYEEFKRKGSNARRQQQQQQQHQHPYHHQHMNTKKELPMLTPSPSIATLSGPPPSAGFPDKQTTLEIITGSVLSLPHSPKDFNSPRPPGSSNPGANGSGGASTLTSSPGAATFGPPSSSPVPSMASSSSAATGASPPAQHARIVPEAAARSGSSFRARNYPRIKRFFGERPPSELISSNLTSFFPNHKRDLLETAGINAKRLSTTRRLSQASRNDSYNSSRNSVLPELVSVLGVDMDKFLDHVEDDDQECNKSMGDELDYAKQVTTKLAALDMTSSDEDDDDDHDDDGNHYDHDRRQPPLSQQQHQNDDEDEDDDFQSAVDDSRPALKSQDELNHYGSTNGTSNDGSRANTPLNKPPLSPSLAANRSTSLSYLNGSKKPSTPSKGPDDYFMPAPPAAMMHFTPPAGAGPGEGMTWMKGSLIGRGTFGDVYLGLNPLSGELMAVKQVELPVENSASVERKKSMVEALRREIALLQELQHENIVQYLGSESDDAHFSIFLEYVPGGSVAGLLASYGAFQEPLVRSFVRQILKGLTYLHGKDIIHRDIKGANVLVDNKGGVKISDFGISKKVEEDIMQVTSTAAHRPSLQGSIFWMAPEVVKQTQYTKKADIWSLGCMVVEMFTGDHPFPAFSQMQAIFQIGSYTMPDIPNHVSSEAKDFLKCTFQLDHEKRPTAHELLSHPFLADDEP
ncbi:hypothetical protein BC940DRAFT_294119 [Gongronella butleri]|nr:hypothetical protein BC940DRAFT_294119 [Gongronella butleri]